MAQAPDGRTGRLAGAAGIALVLVGLTLLLEPASWRPAAAVLLAVGLAVGTVVAIRRPPSGRLRTPMERLNDAAFLLVVAIVALIAVRLAHGRNPGHSDPAPGTASSDPGRTDPAPGRAGTPAPGTEPPGGGE